MYNFTLQLFFINTNTPRTRTIYVYIKYASTILRILYYDNILIIFIKTHYKIISFVDIHDVHMFIIVRLTIGA